MCVIQDDFITFDDSDEETSYKPLNQKSLKVEEKKEEEEDDGELDIDAI